MTKEHGQQLGIPDKRPVKKESLRQKIQRIGRGVKEEVKAMFEDFDPNYPTPRTPPM